MKNFNILDEIYNGLIINEEQDSKYYEDNYFYEEIKEFIDSFDYLKSIILLKDKQVDKLINKIQKYFEENSNVKLEEKEKGIKLSNTKKIKELIKKYNLNMDEVEFENNNYSNDKNEIFSDKKISDNDSQFSLCFIKSKK